MPSPFPCNLVIRECSWKKNKTEKKNQLFFDEIIPLNKKKINEVYDDVNQWMVLHSNYIKNNKWLSIRSFLKINDLCKWNRNPLGHLI